MDRADVARLTAAGGSFWNANTVARLDLPQQIGAEFTYEGKQKRSRWTVIAANDDGSIVAKKLS